MSSCQYYDPDQDRYYHWRQDDQAYVYETGERLHRTGTTSSTEGDSKLADQIDTLRSLNKSLLLPLKTHREKHIRHVQFCKVRLSGGKKRKASFFSVGRVFKALMPRELHPVHLYECCDIAPQNDLEVRLFVVIERGSKSSICFPIVRGQDHNKSLSNTRTEQYCHARKSLAEPEESQGRCLPAVNIRVPRQAKKKLKFSHIYLGEVYIIPHFTVVGRFGEVSDDFSPHEQYWQELKRSHDRFRAHNQNVMGGPDDDGDNDDSMECDSDGQESHNDQENDQDDMRDS